MFLYLVFLINNGVIIQWFYNPGTAYGEQVLPVTYTSELSYACSAIIHNPDTTVYSPSIHIITRTSSSVVFSVRYNGSGLTQTFLGITIGY